MISFRFAWNKTVPHPGHKYIILLRPSHLESLREYTANMDRVK